MSYWESVGQSDDWWTPRYIFDALNCRFDLDVSAPSQGPLHVPCDAWIHEDSLEKPWKGFVWMNPPFGGRNSLCPWLHKFMTHQNGIALVPDRTSAQWWQMIAKQVDAILFISNKVKFIRPDGSFGKNPSTGTALMAIGEKGVEALIAAEHAGLGLCFSRHCASALAQQKEGGE